MEGRPARRRGLARRALFDLHPVSRRRLLDVREPSCQRCVSKVGEEWSGADLTVGASMDGGYAEYVTLASEALVSIPDDIDPAQAAPLLCAGLTVYSVSRLLFRPTAHPIIDPS